MALNTYSTGTVSVTTGGAVTVAGGIWGGPNVVAGDMVSVDSGAALLINDVTDATHGQLVGWSGGAVSGKDYVAYKCSSLRFDDVQMAEDAKDIVAAFNTDGFIHFVKASASVPDPSLGDDGQYAHKPSTGAWWQKVDGLWIQTVAPLASYGGTSTTSVPIGTGTKVFTTQAGLQYYGARVRASAAANPAYWIEGPAVYSGTTLTILADASSGDGNTYADWVFAIAAEPGDQAGYTPQVRLTLASGTPVTTSDIAMATTIYATPCGGNQIPIYDGSKFVVRTFSEIALALDSNSGHALYHASGVVFDVFAFLDGGAVKIATNAGWTASRGSGSTSLELENYAGYLVNKNAIEIRYGSGSGDHGVLAARMGTYLGSFYTTANGQTTDTKESRLVFNAHNPARRILRRVDPQTTGSDYSTPAWRQANGSSANRVAVLCGLLTTVSVVANFVVKNSTSTIRQVWGGIGVDSSTVNSAEGGVGTPAVLAVSFKVNYNDAPGLGYHELRQLEFASGSDVQTWFYTLSGFAAGGLSGEIWC